LDLVQDSFRTTVVGYKHFHVPKRQMLKPISNSFYELFKSHQTHRLKRVAHNKYMSTYSLFVIVTRIQAGRPREESWFDYKYRQGIHLFTKASRFALCSSKFLMKLERRFLSLVGGVTGICNWIITLLRAGVNTSGAVSPPTLCVFMSWTGTNLLHVTSLHFTMLSTNFKAELTFVLATVLLFAVNSWFHISVSLISPHLTTFLHRSLPHTKTDI
jgi:hypothetical protein